MISILIPVFNTEITKLINSLIISAEKAAVPYQIIVLDDASDKYYQTLNQEVSHFFNVSYISLSENVGRAKIRNKLAQLASQPYLLFIDCDSKIIADNSYINTYMEHATKGIIISGGRIYESETSKEFAIHHQYGSKVESKLASRRNKSPYENFHSNNFMIHCDDFNKIKFDESIKGYGYEDLEFAHRVKMNHLKIKHIDNPVIHDKLDSNHSFLDKSYHAVLNLHELHKNNKIPATKLIRTYESCKHLLNIFPFKNKLISYLHESLIKGNYSAFKFQILKLMWFDGLGKA